ncbi:hypothetical protein OICFNHDK_4280 [Methylobacterium bullatum]|uniref:Uncharacterized protein n=1 Tax=Methylobacterium bullatum TaxID=570505 RepID=A0AAV4ZCN2_9HYPH|nr:hypothetical protein OICFNHDK_4280 [Methylobacterium bullatum]
MIVAGPAYSTMRVSSGGFLRDPYVDRVCMQRSTGVNPVGRFP